MEEGAAQRWRKEEVIGKVERRVAARCLCILCVWMRDWEGAGWVDLTRLRGENVELHWKLVCCVGAEKDPSYCHYSYYFNSCYQCYFLLILVLFWSLSITKLHQLTTCHMRDEGDEVHQAILEGCDFSFYYYFFLSCRAIVTFDGGWQYRTAEKTAALLMFHTTDTAASLSHQSDVNRFYIMQSADNNAFLKIVFFVLRAQKECK